MRRVLEDFEPGRVWELGERTLREEEMVAFAREFDPQPMHTDAAAAREGPFGGLVASGWHTCAVLMRLYVETVLGGDSVPGSAIDELRWTSPVRPGERLHGRASVVEASPSRSRPDRGTVRIRLELLRGDEPVVSFVARIHLPRRAPRAVPEREPLPQGRVRPRDRTHARRSRAR